MDATDKAVIDIDERTLYQNSAHERLEALLYGQGEILEMISRGAPLSKILTSIVQWVEKQSSDGLVASILLLDGAGRRLVHGAAPNLPQEYNDAIHGIQIGPKAGSCGTAAFTRKTVIVDDIQNSELWKDYRSIALKHGLKACWSSPLISKNDRVLGTFAIYYKEARTPTVDDLQIIRLVSRMAILAIESKQAEDEKTHLQSAEKKMYEKLIQERQHFYRLLMHSPALIAVLKGKDHVYELANELYLNSIAGNRVVIGKPIREALPELAGQGIFEILDQVYTSGEPYTHREFHVRLNRKTANDLDDLYFSFTFQPLKNENGVVEGILVHAVDLTEQVASRKAIEASEARYRNLIEQSTVAAAVYTGPNMIIQYANDAMIRLWGKDRSVMGKPLADALPELEGQPFHTLLYNVYTTGETYWGAEDVVDLLIDGRLHRGYYNFTYKALRNEDGAIYGILNMAVEVTDQVLAKKGIEESEKNFRSLVMQAPVGICILKGENFLVEIANNNYLQLARKTSEQLVGKPLWEGLWDAKTKELDDLLKKVLRTGESIHAREHEIELNIAGQPKKFYFDFVYAPLHEIDGSVTKIMVIAMEVTDKVIARKRIEEVVAERTKDLRDANLNLERSNKELETFAYVASHDLQEPLRKIKTFASMLSGAADHGSGKDKSYVNKIISSSERMSTLINDILNFSRLVRPGIQLVPTDLNVVFKNVLDDLEVEIENKGAVIKADSLPVIQAVKAQMNQLFFNLLSNSLKFTRPDVTPKISVKLHSVTEEDRSRHPELSSNKSYFKIVFTDNGIGFDQKFSEQIFTIFQRLNDKTYPGSGIGLALCRRIVNNHCGEIYAVSEAGKGAQFHIILPDKP
jgi:PAS domain S-box-containing protein